MSPPHTKTFLERLHSQRRAGQRLVGVHGLQFKPFSLTFDMNLIIMLFNVLQMPESLIKPHNLGKLLQRI